MKKIIFLLPLIALNTLGLTGCKSSNKSRITYGTLVESTAMELNYSSFVNHVTSDETMLIAVYDDYSSVPCGCWLAFKGVLNEYVDTYDILMTKLDRIEGKIEEISLSERYKESVDKVSCLKGLTRQGALTIISESSNKRFCETEFGAA